jgi:phosphoribosyl-ATP pyrophosphohydrolase|tara:strand:- start:1756 stop:2145 length:390 start_codon:yes stop_codon:yes gene_type:complete
MTQERETDRPDAPALLRPEEVYSGDLAVLDRLYRVILSRRGADRKSSHTAKLFSKGTAKIAQKVGEEAVETVIEAVKGDREALVAESADLLYHLLVLWADQNVQPAQIWQKLCEREGISGVAEKASRRK